LVKQVLDIFDPATFTITIFANTSSDKQFRMTELARTAFADLQSYRKSPRITYEFNNGYTLFYSHYDKQFANPSPKLVTPKSATSTNSDDNGNGNKSPVSPSASAKSNENDQKNNLSVSSSSSSASSCSSSSSEAIS
jgi:hypothetical protein